MALKNLYDMVKADRYTADGREAIIKAQEAETEDKVYQIGEISQKTGLQKTANGWVKPKSGKQPGAKKQEKKGAGIPQATTETFVGKTYKDFVESATPSGYKPTKNTDNPDGSSTTVFEKEGKRLKVDFDKSGKITKVTPAESKTAAPVKRNEAEIVKHSDGTKSYRIKGTQFYFNTPEEAENAILAKNRGGTTYARPSQDSTVNNIQESLEFKLDTPYGGKHSMDDFMKKTGENEYAVNVWSFGTDSKGTLINPLSETDKPNATIKKENGEWKLHYKDRDGKETVVTANGRQDPTRDSAPRVLTGDTRIRVRKA